MLIILQCFKDFYLRARQGGELRAPRASFSSREGISEKYRSARPRLKERALQLCGFRRQKAPSGGTHGAHPAQPRARGARARPGWRSRGSGSELPAKPACPAPRAGRQRQRNPPSACLLTQLRKFSGFFYKQGRNSIQAGITSVRGRGGLCVTRNFLLHKDDLTGCIWERDSQAKPLPQKSRRRPSPELPPPGDRPGGTFSCPDSCLSKSCRKPTIFPDRHFPPGLTWFPFVLSLSLGSAPAPAVPPPGAPDPAGTYVVAEGKGPSEEWFITRDWKSVRLKTSSHPAAIFLIEDRSPFPKSARRQ